MRVIAAIGYPDLDLVRRSRLPGKPMSSDFLTNMWKGFSRPLEVSDIAGIPTYLTPAYLALMAAVALSKIY
jgi:hypothetical protein